MSSLQRAGGRIPLRSLHLRGLQVVLWQKLQQPVGDPGVPQQLHLRHRQEEQNLLQGLPAAQVSHGRDVQVRLSVRKAVKLVQDPLLNAEERQGDCP